MKYFVKAFENFHARIEKRLFISIIFQNIWRILKQYKSIEEKGLFIKTAPRLTLQWMAKRLDEKDTADFYGTEYFILASL